MSKKDFVFLALGSNLDNPKSQVLEAIGKINSIPDVELIKKSNLYKTKAVGGPKGQPDYINAVVLCMTTMTPLKLLSVLQRIEIEQGRVRGEERNLPRTIDIDILLHGDIRMNSERLEIPHPRMHIRDFVLTPLKDICLRTYENIVSGMWPCISYADLESIEFDRSTSYEDKVGR